MCPFTTQVLEERTHTSSIMNSTNATDQFSHAVPCSSATGCTMECAFCNIGATIVNGECVSCPDPYMTKTTGECTCIDGFTQLSDQCLHAATAQEVVSLYQAPAAYTVEYPDISSAGGSFSTSVTSVAFQEHFYAAAVNCKRGISVRHCQLLANLCVLQMYLKTASACGYFSKSVSTQGQISNQHDFSGWYAAIGFLYFENNQIAQDTTLKSVMAFESTANYVHRLNFQLAKYAFNGTYLGYTNLTNQLQLCGGHYETTTRWMNFGTQYVNSCQIRLESILDNTEETVFYDPYFVDADNTWYPIPVMVTNVRTNGVKVNEKDDAYQHVYTRRIFTYDTISGVTAKGQSPDVIRFISKAVLNFKLQTGEIQKIYPPILEVEYAEVDVKNLPSGSAASRSSMFQSLYQYDLTVYEASMVELLITMIIFVIVVWIFRVYLWTRTNGSDDLNRFFIFTAFVYFWHTVGTIVGIGIIGYSWYWYAFYKWQGLITVMVPDNDALYNYYAALGLAMTGQLIGVMYIIWYQTCITVFFIDWESSQGRMPGRDGRTSKCPVSTWRQLFVANEFNRLQTERVISFEFTCMWVTAFMVGFELQYAACLAPDGSDLYACDQANISGILRFSVSTFFWIVIVLIQVLYVKTIHNRYVRHATSQLVDLMSLTNISAFILTDKFAGYYIHGQSNLPHADTDLEEVARILDSEEKNITSSRGLLPDDDTQTFVMHITQSVREKFDDFFQYEEDTSDRLARAGMGAITEEFNNRGVRTVLKQSEPVYQQFRGINTNLKGFVKKMQTTYNHKITEMTWMERVGFPPGRDDMEYAVFHRDNHGSWVKIFYEGIEHELLLFDIMLFGFWQVCLDSTMNSILLTYLTQKAMDLIRQELGSKNLARTTLVGERFFL